MGFTIQHTSLVRAMLSLTALLLLFTQPILGNVQIYRTGQTGADAQGNIIWKPQTIVSMKDETGTYFDLEFEADAGLVMYDARGNRLWGTNTGGHDCSVYCALRWTPDGLLQILVETQRGPQPIWSTNTFGDNQGRYLTFGAKAPYVAVYTHNYTVAYSSGGSDGGDDPDDVLKLCGAVPCYLCYDSNCMSGGDDGTQGAGVWGDPDNQPGSPGDDDGGD